MVDRKGNEALDAVLHALADQVDLVRTHALYGAIGGGVEIPADILANLVLRDPSVDVRFLALNALVGDTNVEAIAQDALEDSSPHIRNKAREILKRLETTARLQESRQPAHGQP